jgi:hypothetical protein
MRKGWICGAIIAAVFLLSGTASAAYAPPINNLAPTSGSTLTVNQGGSVRVEFSCPRFTTSFSSVTRDWVNYYVEFSTSTTKNAEGEFLDSLAFPSVLPVTGNDEICEATVPESSFPKGVAIYWDASRINCDAVSCAEYGPVWSFAITNPPPPAAPTPVTPASPSPISPSPTSPSPAAPTPLSGEGRVSVYVGCGTNRSTKAAATCGKNQPIGAFFKDSKETVYTVCVRYPGGLKACAHKQRAAAGIVYVNAVKRHSAGQYTVTWTVGARRFVKHVYRTAS